MAIKHGDPDAPLVKEVPNPLTTGSWEGYHGRTLCIVFTFIYKKKIILIEHLGELFSSQTHSSYSYLTTKMFAMLFFKGPFSAT